MANPKGRTSQSRFWVVQLLVRRAHLSKWTLLNKQVKNNSAFKVTGSQLELDENFSLVIYKYHIYTHTVGKEKPYVGGMSV